MVSPDDVEKIANLADISLSRDRLGEFTREFNAILDYFNVLDTVREEAGEMRGEFNVMREDEITPSLPQGADSADPTSDASLAAKAGVPLPEGYAPPPAPARGPPLANPCLAPGAGTSPGLAATFYGADAVAPGGALSFSGPPAAARCDCPNHRAPTPPWPGAPALPPTLGPRFGVSMTGQVLVARPPGGVAGEGGDLFPTASDYHLACLQHDGAAALTLDGTVLYESTSGDGGRGVGEGGGGGGGRVAARARAPKPRLPGHTPPPLPFPLPRLQAVLRPHVAHPRLAQRDDRLRARPRRQRGQRRRRGRGGAAPLHR